MWKLRDLAVESEYLLVVSRADTGATRAVVQVWWWMCYQFTIRISPALLDVLTWSSVIMVFKSDFNSRPRYLEHIASMLITYRLWFREL